MYIHNHWNIFRKILLCLYLLKNSKRNIPKDHIKQKESKLCLWKRGYRDTLQKWKVIKVRIMSNKLRKLLLKWYRRTITDLVHHQLATLKNLSNTDDDKHILVIMLNLSAVFDTLDHAIVQRRLTFMPGISVSTLQWFHFYCTDHKQKVVANDVFSKSTSVKSGIPHESVLRPILLTVYMLSPGKQYRSMVYNFPDDCQLYITSNNADPNDSMSNAESLVSDSAFGIPGICSYGMILTPKCSWLVLHFGKTSIHFRKICIGESIMTYASASVYKSENYVLF